MPQIVNKKSVLEMAMGAIAEITDYEVERVVANIMDPNTNATAKRKITISEDGMTNANSPESDSIKAWGGDTVHTYQTEKPDTFQFQLIEALNAEVLKAVYRDDNVTGDLETGLTVKANAKEQQDACWVVETILNGDTVKRVVVPCAKITEIEDIVYKDDEALGYGVTISATPDSAGNTHYEYLKKGSA